MSDNCAALAINLANYNACALALNATSPTTAFLPVTTSASDSSLNQTNLSAARRLLTGYDLPVQGLDNGKFNLIHGTAIACLAMSIVSAALTITLTCRSRRWAVGSFTSWSTGDRSLIYMALFDACFNITHISDHLVYLVQRAHPHPAALCTMFGFMLSIFQIAQNVYVSCLAVKGCIMVYRMRVVGPLERDAPSLLVSIGSGLVVSVILLATDLFGPSGAFCFMDPVKAPMLLMISTTVFLIGTGLFNLVLYLLTVVSLHSSERQNRRCLGHKSQLRRSVRTTAWTCSYFVLSFFFQWTSVSVYGAWTLFTSTPPFWLFLVVTSTTNLGGLFNLVLFLYIRLKRRRRRKRRAQQHGTNNRRLVPMYTST